MRELPILFSAPMVRCDLGVRKTVTRRVMKLPIRDPDWGCELAGNEICEATTYRTCPYGMPGDRLWVKEAWRAPASLDAFSGSAISDRCMEAGYRKPWAPVRYEADGALSSAKDWREFGSTPGEAAPGRYRHARFMPRWASRITLEVTAVRVERLQDIDQAQAMAEGIDGEALFRAQGYAPLAFQRLWESINGAGSWADNPRVWVVEFRRTEASHG